MQMLWCVLERNKKFLHYTVFTIPRRTDTYSIPYTYMAIHFLRVYPKNKSCYFEHFSAITNTNIHNWRICQRLCINSNSVITANIVIPEILHIGNIYRIMVKQ